jgi:hypothetical protein
VCICVPAKEGQTQDTAMHKSGESNGGFTYLLAMDNFRSTYEVLTQEAYPACGFGGKIDDSSLKPLIMGHFCSLGYNEHHFH